MKKHFLAYSTLLLASSFLSSHALAGCWSVKDRVDMAMTELDATTTFSIRDAVTCKPVAGAAMKIGDDTLTTDALGEVKISAMNDLMDESFAYTLSKPGYMTINDKFKVEAGVVHPTRLLMSKSISADAVRFVLSWSDEPADLDLHLIGKDFHVSYRNMRNYKNLVILDADAEQGYGAETITVGKKNTDDVYRLLVHNFSAEVGANIDQQARVSVYINGRLDKVIRLADTTKPVVEVLQLRHGVIKYLNQPKDSL